MTMPERPFNPEDEHKFNLTPAQEHVMDMVTEGLLMPLGDEDTAERYTASRVGDGLTWLAMETAMSPEASEAYAAASQRLDLLDQMKGLDPETM